MKEQFIELTSSKDMKLMINVAHIVYIGAYITDKPGSTIVVFDTLNSNKQPKYIKPKESYEQIQELVMGSIKGEKLE